jgi:hypothetical protein
LIQMIKLKFIILHLQYLLIKITIIGFLTLRKIITEII